MAENKTQPTDASVREFLEAVPDEKRRADGLALLPLFERVTGEPAVMWGGSIVGFGMYHYQGKSRGGEWMIVGFSPRKTALTIYGVFDGYGEPDPLFDQLGPHTTGKGCVYLKRLSDVDPAVLETLIANAYARGGQHAD